MNIKEEIGRRIYEARKAKGLTRKALAEATDDLKPSRINNWERGDRTPGAEEIKQLSKVLEVSPAFLMCLTDEKQPKKIPGLGALIPLLDHKQACEPQKYIQTIKSGGNVDAVTFIPVSSQVSSNLGEYVFALKMIDDSMEPELRRGDILIIDPDKLPNPGEFLVAKLEDNDAVIIRRYKQLAATRNVHAFELQAINNNWATIRIDNTDTNKIVGSLISLIRKMRSA